MGIIEGIQTISNPVLDWIMRIITEAGDVTFAIVLGVILFWIIDKKFAYKLMLSLLLSAGINGVVKQLVKAPRPFHKDPSVDIMNLKTEGYSFPSGHSQNIAVISSMVGYNYRKNTWVKSIFIALLILVPFSRMYLGQHFLEDVLVGALIGVVIGTAGLYFLTKYEKYEDYIGLALIPVSIIFMIIFRNENQIFVAGGALTGLVIGYILEKRFVDYDVKAVWWVQILKLVIGLAVALALKEGLKPLFNLIAKDSNVLDAVRYMLVALWATFGAMALFKAIFPNKK